MRALPIHLNSGHGHALVAGGQECGLNTARPLWRAGWPVRVLASQLCPALKSYHANGYFDWDDRTPDEHDIRAATLVFAASDSAAANRRTARMAARAGRLFSDLTTGEGNFQIEPDALVESHRETPWTNARVCLVGAGPGDPGLLTVNAQLALAGADVVLHDRLVSDEVLACIPNDIERIFVGKRRSHHYYTQDELNAFMVERARSGQRVARLKGGDPFMFGRGGEELSALLEAGIATRVIPGISAGSGCATYADIPLTHRDYASSCQFITAHVRDGEADYDWEALVRAQHTLVVYMGVAALRNLCPRLIDNGMNPDMPAALIERGTLPEQRVMTGTVATLPRIAEQHELRSPAALIIGEVVRLRNQIHQQESAVSARA